MTPSSRTLIMATLLCTPLPALAQEDDIDLLMQEAEIVNGRADSIIVVGHRLRGDVLGAVEPELRFDADHIRSLGLSNIAELIAELSPQLQSNRGGQPLVLLEGRRISSRREVDSIPPEAIVRVDILPESVALRYGYPADQKIMNIVLRERFRAFVGETKERITSGGGASKREGQLDYLSIRNGARFTMTAEYVDTTNVPERKRGIFASDGSDTLRTISPASQNFKLSGTYNRPLSHWVSASLTGELTSVETQALLGPAATAVVLPASNSHATSGSDTLIKPLLRGWDALRRSSSTQAVHIGSTVNAEGKKWSGTFTATLDHDEGRTISGRSPDLSLFQAALIANDPAVDPANPVPSALISGHPADVSTMRSDIVAGDLSVNGPVQTLPAGDVALTLRLGGSKSSFRSQTERDYLVQSAHLGRSTGLGALSLDVPLIDSGRRFPGGVSINGNAQLRRLSDFGTVRTLGYGVNWSPARGLSFALSYSSEDTAPSVQQLGDPTILTPSVRTFDYVTGQTVLIEQISGGNADLVKARAQTWHAAMVMKAKSNPDISLLFNYDRERTRNGIVSLPSATVLAQQAFPDRFFRDANNMLIAVDARPVNIARSETQVIRWGVNFSKSLKSSSLRRSEDATGARDAASGLPRGRREGRINGGFGAMGRQRSLAGRLSFSIYHSLYLMSRATLADGVPTLNLLDGDALTSGAGQPRHAISARASFSKGAMGSLLRVDWQSATRIDDPLDRPSANLHFGSLATFDLHVFTNLDQIGSLAARHPWTKNLRISVGINNIFNARQQVTDGTGTVPLAYRPAFLDPVGRSMSISIRKLFN